MVMWTLLFRSTWFSLLVSGPHEGHQKCKVPKTHCHPPRTKHQLQPRDVTESQNRGHAQGRKHVQVGQNAEAAYHFLWLLEHKLATLKVQKGIHSSGGQKSTVRVRAGPHSPWRLQGRISSLSGLGDTGSPWLVTTSLQPVSTLPPA